MAEKSDLPLTQQEQEVVREAYNVLSDAQGNGNKKLESLAWDIRNQIAKNPRKEVALETFWAECKPDEDYDSRRFRAQMKFLTETFYSTTIASGGFAYFIRRHEAQKADELVNVMAVIDTLNRRFDNDISPAILKGLGSIIPITVSREYQPNGDPIVYSDHAAFANTWVPPRIKPSGNGPTKRPAFWQEYLDRLMPKHHECWWISHDGEKVSVPQQDYFEAWLAQRICHPQEENIVSVVLRGNFGTGKGFWLDTIARELVGMANYQPVTTKAWKGDFNGDMFDSVIIHLEETNDTRANTADMLKMLISQDRHRANVKNLPQKFVQRHFAIAISSNYYDPIKIDQHDRRYFVPVWSEHKDGPDGKNQTQVFFAEFSQWLSIRGGFQELRDWFEVVDWSRFNFRMAPDTKAKDEISSKAEPTDSRKTQVLSWLLSQRGQTVAFTATELASANFPMTDIEAQATLRQAGYVSVQRKFAGSKHNIWLPKEHKDTKRLHQTGWTLWRRGGLDIELPEEDPIDDDKMHWHEEEKQLWARVVVGEAVVINEYKHSNIKGQAAAGNLLVNIMRPTSGGTIYGNPEPSTRVRITQEDRDRMCDAYENEHVHKLSGADIQVLKGKVLMCRCKPARCHGDTLARMANDT